MSGASKPPWMRAQKQPPKLVNWSALISWRAPTKDWRVWASGCSSSRMKILVANLGSTSLKWRLFDFSNSQEQLLHKGGFERVTDYPKAIGDCLAQLKDAGHIRSEAELAA